MNLQETVQQELNKMIDAGRVQEIIKKHLETSIDDTFKDALRSWSDFGKELKKVISEAVKVDLSKLTLLDYNHIVTTIVKEELDKTIYSSVKSPIAEAIKDYTGQLDKKEWKLSEIIEKFISRLKEDESEGEITLHVEESSYGYRHIYFDEKSGKRACQCEYQIDTDKEGKVYSFKAGSYNPTTGDIRKRPVHGSFEGFIFKLYAMGCKVEANEYECVTEWTYEY